MAEHMEGRAPATQAASIDRAPQGFLGSCLPHLYPWTLVLPVHVQTVGLRCGEAPQASSPCSLPTGPGPFLGGLAGRGSTPPRPPEALGVGCSALGCSSREPPAAAGL